MKTVFSGIQPSGLVHLGNLLGAINNWVKLSNEESKNYFCIVDLHSLTALPNKTTLKASIRDTLKVLMASGINMKNSVVYVQSDLKEHAYLSWILSNFCQVGELQRMTQFKEKSNSFGTHSGLLTYPILMAADILIHKANEVPVGDDQTQHLEITRNIAERFNNNYEDIFPIPKKTSGKSGARLMSLRHPANKMSKSSDDFNGTIYFNDSKDSIIKKFKSSVTDSQNEIKYDMESKPGISNLIEIYSAINAIELKDTEKQFQDFRYGDFKLAVAESVISYLEPIAEKFREISDSQIDSAIENNLKLAKVSAELTISEIETALGID
jgi:tryptophanyl-tRNA synthetase